MQERIRQLETVWNAVAVAPLNPPLPTARNYCDFQLHQQQAAQALEKSLNILQGVSQTELSQSLNGHSFETRQVYVPSRNVGFVKKTIADALLQAAAAKRREHS